MKDEAPLRVPDPSATIPDFGPRPDLSNAPNLAALMGGPSPMGESNDEAAAARKASEPKAKRPPTRDIPPPPLSRAAKQTPVPEKNGPSMAVIVGVGLVLALLAGGAAFGLTLLLGLGAVFALG
jgi:hypothetical protein